MNVKTAFSVKQILHHEVWRDKRNTFWSDGDIKVANMSHCLTLLQGRQMLKNKQDNTIYNDDTLILALQVSSKGELKLHKTRQFHLSSFSFLFGRHSGD